MARKRVGHPSWFKLNIERQEFLKSLPAQTAVTCLMNCFEYLVTHQKPKLSDLDNVCFSVFFPDLESAWAAYNQRTSAGFQAESEDTSVHGRVPSCTSAPDKETETDIDIDTDSDRQTNRSIDSGGQAGCLAVPCLDDVLSFASECGAGKEMARTFYDTNAARNWSIKGQPIRDWRKLFRSWLEHERKQPAKTGLYTEQDYADSAKYCLC